MPTSTNPYIERAERQLAEAQAKLDETKRLSTALAEATELHAEAADKIESINTRLAELLGANGAGPVTPAASEPPEEEDEDKPPQEHAVGPKNTYNRLLELFTWFVGVYADAKAGKRLRYVRMKDNSVWVHLGDFCLDHERDKVITTWYVLNWMGLAQTVISKVKPVTRMKRCGGVDRAYTAIWVQLGSACRSQRAVEKQLKNRRVEIKGFDNKKWWPMWMKLGHRKPSCHADLVAIIKHFCTHRHYPKIDHSKL